MGAQLSRCKHADRTRSPIWVCAIAPGSQKTAGLVAKRIDPEDDETLQRFSVEAIAGD